MSNPRRHLELPIEEYRLANGLSVTLVRDDAVPLVAVDLWYHVGAKDEDPSRTGLAHLLEHLMFEGSLRHNAEYFRPLQEAGGSINGSTSSDRTNYYEVVPSHFLERALWLEADRMGGLLPVLTSEKLETQRGVVINERRQRVDNQPYGRVHEELSKRLFPAPHPYSWPVIGWQEHLEAMTLGEVADFWTRHYQPSNASLVVAGSFDRDQARRWIDDYFGSISDRPAPVWTATMPALAAPASLEFTDAVALPRLDWVWRTFPAFDPQEASLDMASHVLAGRSKDARLKRRLVREERLASSVAAYHATGRIDGQFAIRVHALEGADLERIDAITFEEIHRLAETPPSEEELERIRRDFQNHAFSRVETALGRADGLQYYRFHHVPLAPDVFAVDLKRYDAVTSEDISAATRRWIVGQPLVRARVVPSGEKPRAASAASPVDSAADRQRPTRADGEASVLSLPGPGPVPSLRLPAVERFTLSSGLAVRLVRRRNQPRVDAQLVVRAGAAYDPIGQFGLHRLTADVMDEGTETSDGLTIARRLDQLGAMLGVGAGVESFVVWTRTLRETLDEAMAVFAEVTRAPRFAAEDVERERARLLAGISHREKQPASVADDAIDAAIFTSSHPYGRPNDGRREDVERLDPSDLRRAHAAAVAPADATLIVVGDVDLDEAARLIEKTLGDWTGKPTIPDVPLGMERPSGERGGFLTFIPWPGAAQSSLRLGLTSPPRLDADYFPLLLFNTILGGQFTSRLNRSLREEKGYTYGARSGVSPRRFAGAFVAGADVGSAVTAPALETFLAELAGPLAAHPLSEEELRFAKDYLIRRFPARFETSAGVANHLAHLAVYDLPDDFAERYCDDVESVTLGSATAAANRLFAADDLRIVVVGDPANADGLEERARLAWTERRCSKQ